MSSEILKPVYFALSFFDKVNRKKDFEYLNCVWHYSHQRQFPGHPENWLYRSYKVDGIPLDLSIHIKQNRGMFFFLNDIPISLFTMKEIINGFLLSKKISDLDEFRL